MKQVMNRAFVLSMLLVTMLFSVKAQNATYQIQTNFDHVDPVGDSMYSIKCIVDLSMVPTVEFIELVMNDFSDQTEISQTVVHINNEIVVTKENTPRTVSFYLEGAFPKGEYKYHLWLKAMDGTRSEESLLVTD